MYTRLQKMIKYLDLTYHCVALCNSEGYELGFMSLPCTLEFVLPNTFFVYKGKMQSKYTLATELHATAVGFMERAMIQACCDKAAQQALKDLQEIYLIKAGLDFIPGEGLWTK